MLLYQPGQCSFFFNILKLYTTLTGWASLHKEANLTTERERQLTTARASRIPIYILGDPGPGRLSGQRDFRGRKFTTTTICPALGLRGCISVYMSILDARVVVN